MAYIHIWEAGVNKSQEEEMKNDMYGLLLGNLDNEGSGWISSQVWGWSWICDCFSHGICYLEELQIQWEGQQK